MPTIKYLSWNIQNYSLSKYYEGNVVQTKAWDNGWGRKKSTKIQVPKRNRTLLIGLICKAAKENDANMISILEISKSTSINICNNIKSQLNITYSSTDWNYSIINRSIARYQSEVYLLFWRSGQGFVKVDNSSSSSQVLRGLINQDSGGTPLKFQRGKKSSASNGLPPGYFVFKTTNSPAEYFTIFTYHSVFKQTVKDYWGVNSYQQVAPVSKINDGSNRTINKLILSGDLNVDLLINSSQYKEFGKQSCTLSLKKSDGNFTKKSLVAGTLLTGFTNPQGYRTNAYDNVAAKGATSITNSKVIDLISDLVTTTSNPYDAITGSFVKVAIKSPTVYTLTLPPPNTEDSWELYYYTVSDHLPVFAKITF